MNANLYLPLMETPSRLLKNLGFTYQEIGDVLLDIISDEDEPMSEFLIDWGDYVSSEDTISRGGETEVNKLQMQNTPEFQQLLEITHSFVLECLRSRYIETGEDCHPMMKIADFLKEVFTRYHESIEGQ